MTKTGGIAVPAKLNFAGRWPGPWELEWVDQEGVPHPFRHTKVSEARRAMKAWLRGKENREVVEEKGGEMLKSIDDITRETLCGMEELRRVVDKRTRKVKRMNQQGKVAMAFLGELVSGLFVSASRQMGKALRKANTTWEPEVTNSRDDDAQDVMEWLFRR